MQTGEDASISMHGPIPWICRMYMEVCAYSSETDSHFFQALSPIDSPPRPASLYALAIFQQQLMQKPQMDPLPPARSPPRADSEDPPSWPTHSEKGSQSPCSPSETSQRNKEYNFAGSCSQQIKDYIRCLRKNKRRQELSRWTAWSQVLSRSLAADTQQMDYKAPSCSLKFSPSRPRPIRPQPATIIHHTHDFPQLVLLLTTARRHAPSTFLYDLTVLSHNGRILFHRINLPNTHSLKTEIAALRLQFQFYIAAVDCRDQLLAAIQGQAQQLINQVGIWPQLRAIGALSEPERQGLLREGGSREKGQPFDLPMLTVLTRNIEKYVFLRKEFLYRLTASEEGDLLSQDDLRMTALAHNLLFPWVTPQAGFQEQITPLRETILSLFSQAQIRPKKLHISQETLLGHFPFTLGNAHICWRCKARRTYTHCPSCSSAQTHVMALCLDCFEPHHRETVVVQRLEGRRAVKEWMEMDAVVSKAIGMGSERCKLQAKTENPDPSIH